MELCGAELEQGGRDRGAHKGWWDSIFDHLSSYIGES